MRNRQKSALKWIPVTMAARMLGVSTQRVYELIRVGGLTWMKADKTILVGYDSIVQRRALRGAEQECQSMGTDF